MTTKYTASPMGEVVGFAHVDTADTKYNPDGLFHIKVAYAPSPEVDAFLENLKAEAQSGHDRECEKMTPADRKKYGVYQPFEPEADKEGSETGRFIVTYKQNRILRLRDGSTRTVEIGIKDKSGKGDYKQKVRGGCLVRIMFAPRDNKIVASQKAGCRLDFAMVQVVRGPAAMAFDAVDGYEDDYTHPGEQGAFDPAEGPAPMADSEY